MSSNSFSPEKVGLLVVRIALGIFFIFEGWDKFPWLADPGLLGSILHKWADAGVPIGKWYIEHLLLPGVWIFARLTFLGEVAAGLALFFGFWTRRAAIVTFLLVVNIHVAHSSIFQYGFLSKGDGLPILGGLLALAIAGSDIPLSLSSGLSNARKRK
ncbi:MAG TPA: DoxX family protein [Terriglobia bacterium]|nr:DoxX family protein [Terriglobia bacterium]